jgi:hypothetical protein
LGLLAGASRDVFACRVPRATVRSRKQKEARKVWPCPFLSTKTDNCA